MTKKSNKGTMAYPTIAEISKEVRRRAVSPVELTEQCLARIEKLNPTLNAFVTVTADSALAQARTAEAEIARGDWRGPLHGIPLALKDLIDTAAVPTTAASELYRDRVPAYDAEVVCRLKAVGAVLLGKQNMHEFAYGGSSMISCFGPVRNPLNSAHIAGGSSGGSAAAVAAGMCFAALGTDTGGSIREPAALCGIVGLKPTYGLVSTQGVLPLAPSLDHVGPLTRTVEDAAIVLQAISDWPGVNFAEPLSPHLRLGFPQGLFLEQLDPEVQASFQQARQFLSSKFNGSRELHLPDPGGRVLLAAEAWAVHAENIFLSPNLYQPETLRRLRGGEELTPQELAAARAELAQARLDITRLFDDVDLLITPTTPQPAPSIADLANHPHDLRPREILLLRNTRPFNVWGLPAISVPCGFTKAGLPIGLQIAGNFGAEGLALRLAHWLEKNSTRNRDSHGES